MSRALLATAVVLLTLSGTSIIAQENPQPTQKEPEQRAVPERSTGERAIPRETASRPTPPPPTADRGRSTGEKAVPRDSASRPETPPASSTNTRGHEEVVERSGGRRSDSGEAVGRASRPRGDRRAIGRAVPREEVFDGSDVRFVFVPRVYPYGFTHGAFGLGYFYYDPFWWSWPYGYGAYGYPSGYGSYRLYPTGTLRLKVKPREAQVYVDGYFVGVVNDFDGVFQRLSLETGPHRIEIRADGHEPLVFEVRIQFDETVTYRGELRKIQ